MKTITCSQWNLSGQMKKKKSYLPQIPPTLPQHTHTLSLCYSLTCWNKKKITVIVHSGHSNSNRAWVSEFSLCFWRDVHSARFIVCLIFQFIEKAEELLHCSEELLRSVSVHTSSLPTLLYSSRGLKEKENLHLFLSTISSSQRTAVLPDHPQRAGETPDRTGLWREQSHTYVVICCLGETPFIFTKQCFPMKCS